MKKTSKKLPVKKLIITLCTILCFSLGIFIYTKATEPKYLNSSSPSIRDTVVYKTSEASALFWYNSLVVARVVDQPMEVSAISGERPYHATYTKILIEEVLFGNLKEGDTLYIAQAGNRSGLYQNGWYITDDGYRSEIIDTGGFLRKGERLLMLLGQIHQAYDWEVSLWGLDENMVICSHPRMANARTVSADGTLGYRKGSVFDPASKLYTKIRYRRTSHDFDPYTQPIPAPLAYSGYGTLDEIRNMVPYWIMEQIKAMHAAEPFDLSISYIWDAIDLPHSGTKYLDGVKNILAHESSNKKQHELLNTYFNELYLKKRG